MGWAVPTLQLLLTVYKNKLDTLLSPVTETSPLAEVVLIGMVGSAHPTTTIRSLDLLIHSLEGSLSRSLFARLRDLYRTRYSLV